MSLSGEVAALATRIATEFKAIRTALTMKAPILVPTTSKTAAYTAVVGEMAVMNVAGGGTALTLPAAPANNDRVGFRAVGATQSAPLTISRGGTATIGDSGATSVIEPLAGVTRVYQFESTNNRWLPVTDVKPLTALDARYPVVNKAVGGVYPTRPTVGSFVIWLGTTDPGASAVNGDMWINA